jgi:nitrite reductase/ring-hydroxylating ferredoxin subunit
MARAAPNERAADEIDAAPNAAFTCASCAVPTDRRRFLRDTALAVAGALVAVGATRSTALAMPLAFMEGERGGNGPVTYAIPAADGAQIDKKNEVILVRWQNAIYAFNLSCPHQNTALKWDDRDHEFQCPKHHSRFHPDGSYIPDSGRATRAMDRLAISRAGANVLVDPDKLYQEDTDGPQWTAAMVKLV